MEMSMKSWKLSFCVLEVVAISVLAASQDLLQQLSQDLSANRPAAANDYKVDVPTTQAWTDAKIDLQAGDQLTITATSETNCNPQGMSGAQPSGNLPLSSAAPGALIAKLHDQGTPMLVGSSNQLKADTAGHLYLGVNGTSACSGTFSVTVHRQAMGQGDKLKEELGGAAQIFMQGQFGIAAPSSTSTGTAATLKVSDAALDAALRKDIDGLPRRVNDQFKNLGDMVNFVLVGSEDQVKSALQAANWHIADTSNSNAVLTAALNTYQDKDYLAMPMSTLYLFGRRQDYGYEMAEPIAMVASRHHFRLWKSSYTWDGQPVWAGAGTHDIGFAKDQRNGSVTHKIDPKVDGERTNIGQSLQNAGKTKSLSYYLPPNPVQDAKNATGDGYESDGRILVMLLK
jgi:hypothetical protein